MTYAQLPTSGVSGARLGTAARCLMTPTLPAAPANRAAGGGFSGLRYGRISEGVDKYETGPELPIRSLSGSGTIWPMGMR